MENKLTQVFEKLLTYDWKKLDDFEGIIEQSDAYRKIISQFENYLFQESQNENYNSDKVYEILNLYSEKFQTIQYFGINKSLVNTNLLDSQLKKIIRKNDFENYKNRTTIIGCDCSIRHKFNIEPNSEFLKRLGCNFDGYYTTYVYMCGNCDFKWMITPDDVNGTGIYVICDEINYPINNKNCS